MYLRPTLCIVTFSFSLFSGSPHLSFTSLSRSLHHSMLNWDKWTFLRNNAITGMKASYYACVCLCVFASVCLSVCDTQQLWAHSRADSSWGKTRMQPFVFALVTVCFINAMVICFPLLLWSLCLSKWRKAQRTPIDLSGSRDPVPLSQFPPCQSFMNAAKGKWPWGNCNTQYAQNKGLET